MLAEQLERGLEELGLHLPSSRQQLLLSYLALLKRWNKTYNLTAVRDEHDMLTRHVLDSLTIAPHINDERLIDVGTGAGLPGIPLAIAQPERQFSLLDSNGKKTRFLVQAKAELQLANINVYHTRVEQFAPETGYDTVLSRAFASLNDMIRSCHHILRPGGTFLAMKGQIPDAELITLDQRAELVAIVPLRVPGLVGERCLVTLRSTGSWRES